MILHSIEDHLRTQGPANLTVSASNEASLYILNHNAPIFVILKCATG